MGDESLIKKLKIFLGLHEQVPTKNDFRKPIWADVDDDDDDDLFGRHNDFDRHVDDLHREINRQMDEMLKPFGNGIFDESKIFGPGQFHTFGRIDESDPGPPAHGNVRDYYLKPGFEEDRNYYLKRDTDLDGKVSSNDIVGLLESGKPRIEDVTPFGQGPKGTRKSFFKTIITTSVKKPDGTVETHRIVKDQDGVVEETTTQTQPQLPKATSMDIMSADQIILNLAADLSSFWKVFN